MERRIISISMENEPGALARVAGLFTARGYNIESLAVAPTEDPTLSRMTLVTRGDEQIIDQITKQLNKLVDVYRQTNLSDGPHVERELMLLKVRVDKAQRADLKLLVDMFGGKVLDVTESSCVVELTANSDELDAFLVAVGGGGCDQDPENGSIIEVVRSGPLGMARGPDCLSK